MARARVFKMGDGEWQILVQKTRRGESIDRMTTVQKGQDVKAALRQMVTEFKAAPSEPTP